jgi:hypothetical protein
MPSFGMYPRWMDIGGRHDEACSYNASISPRRIANLLAQLKAAEAPYHDILSGLGNDLTYQVTYHY